jgi:ABC-type spermidine/putrescine transport system permease subunit I
MKKPLKGKRLYLFSVITVILAFVIAHLIFLLVGIIPSKKEIIEALIRIPFVCIFVVATCALMEFLQKNTKGNFKL